MQPMHSLALTAALAATTASPALADGYYCNGQVATDVFGDSYYPNGQPIRDTFGSTYYPNGVEIRDVFDDVHYPNGQAVRDNFDRVYYPNGAVVADSFGHVYYPNGQVTRDTFGCYWSTGVPMNPCLSWVTIRADVPGFGVMEAALTTTSGSLGGVFTPSVRFLSAGPGYTIDFDVDLRYGTVTYVTAYCN